nr:glycosyltransferase family 2 protein [Mangrovicoccus ximenensis]
MSSPPPFLSIVTIVWNGRSSFKKTAASVIREQVPDAEWVVVDGASTDGTVEEIQNVERNVSRWISEKDRGIADAFNKGARLASGEYVLFLNAGDCLALGAAEILNRIATQHRGAPAILGRIEMSGRRHGKAVPFWRQYMRNHLPHQAMLIRRDLFDAVGFYDERRRLGMDFEWSLRLRPVWSEIKFVPDLISIMEPGGVSVSNAEKTFEAYHEARIEHFGKPWLSKFVLIYYRAKRKLLKPVRPLITAIRQKRVQSQPPLK